jgi:RluA family pseudouridine synthase
MILSILFQSNDLVAVDKPAGLSVHNNEDPQNLIIVLERQLKIPKLYPIHRLDKETSGVQVLALNEQGAKTFSSEFEKKTVTKLYTGVLRGNLKTNQGAWTKPLSDKSEGRRNPEGLAKDKVPCETRFNATRDSKYFTLCEFQLITGRQHQIRKHAALANHAIVGDPRYGDLKYNQKIADLYKTSRMFLHCKKIVLKNHVIESQVPDEFVRLFET